MNECETSVDSARSMLPGKPLHSQCSSLGSLLPKFTLLPGKSLRKKHFPQSFLWSPTWGNLWIVFPVNQLSISKHTSKHSSWDWTKDLGFLKVVLVRQRYQNCSHRQPALPWMCPSALDTWHFHLCYRRCLELCHMPGIALSRAVQHQTSASIQQESRKELFLQTSQTTYIAQSLCLRHNYTDRIRLLTKCSCSGA